MKMWGETPSCQSSLNFNRSQKDVTRTIYSGLASCWHFRGAAWILTDASVFMAVVVPFISVILQVGHTHWHFYPSLKREKHDYFIKQNQLLQHPAEPHLMAESQLPMESESCLGKEWIDTPSFFLFFSFLSSFLMAGGAGLTGERIGGQSNLTLTSEETGEKKLIAWQLCWSTERGGRGRKRQLAALIRWRHAIL